MEDPNPDLNIEESSTIEKDKVILNRSWSFWENYESKNKDELNYSELLKEIYTFNDIISFWQFWNNYIGSDPKKIFYNGEYISYFFKEKYRIIAINLFVKGIRPEWEDDKNKKGKIFILEYAVKYDLDVFLKTVAESWLKLVISLIGEEIPFSDYINGIRFYDKTRIGKIPIYRFEIWANTSMSEDNIAELKTFLSKKYGCSATVRNIP